jgi:hypothetical protein
MGRGWMAIRCIITMCWRKKTQLSISKVSKRKIVCRRSQVACQMYTLSESGNYTLLRIWDGMRITNQLSNSVVETSWKANDGWCGSQRTPSISFTPLRSALAEEWCSSASTVKSTLRTAGGRHN